MPLTRPQKLKRRRDAARTRRATERLARREAETDDHPATDQVHHADDAALHLRPPGYVRLPYRPRALMSEEDHMRARVEGRYTAYGDLWIGELPVPPP